MPACSKISNAISPLVQLKITSPKAASAKVPAEAFLPFASTHVKAF